MCVLENTLTKKEKKKKKKNKQTKRISHQIRFVDTFKFMAASLGELVSNLHESHFNNVKNIVQKIESTYFYGRVYTLTFIWIHLED